MTTLYKLNNNGTVSWWKIVVVGDDSYKVSWGPDHTNMVERDNTQLTTPEIKRHTLQEIIEARVNEQVARKGYSYDVPTEKPELPMLAQKWVDFKPKAGTSNSEVEHFNATYLQPKLDGIRCIAGRRTLRSRKNTDFTSVPHIEQMMEDIYSVEAFDPYIRFDGELYIHQQPLATVQSAVSRESYHPYLSNLVQYHIYDVVSLEHNFQTRLAILNSIQYLIDAAYAKLLDSDCRIKPSECPIILVPTIPAPSTKDESFDHILKEVHKAHIDMGYEGTIIRNSDGYYRPNYRSFDLLKYKDVCDAEFEILDILEDKNGGAIFVCKTPENKRFRVSPSFTKARKQQIVNYREKYIGKLLTIEYEKLSEYGVPLKPIGKAIRMD